jgi:hypothetical protein
MNGPLHLLPIDSKLNANKNTGVGGAAWAQFIAFLMFHCRLQHYLLVPRQKTSVRPSNEGNVETFSERGTTIDR